MLLRKKSFKMKSSQIKRAGQAARFFAASHGRVGAGTSGFIYVGGGVMPLGDVLPIAYIPSVL